MTVGEKLLRVLIADEHAMTRAGVRESLDAYPFVVVAEASTRDEAVSAAVRERPELCLLDVDMPGSGVDAAAEIVARLPGTTVIMLADSASDGNLFSALAAGAQGYLLKDMDASRLPHALRGALAGEAALPRELVTKVIDEFRRRRSRRSSPVLKRLGVELTEREWEVSELLREDLPTGVIAERLSISPVTVRRHVSELMGKLGAQTREAAVSLLEDRSVQD